MLFQTSFLGDIIINSGLLIDAYFGFKLYSWLYIFVALLITYTGYCLKRTYQNKMVIRRDGFVIFLIQVVSFQLAMQLLILIPIFFIARLFA